MNVPGNSLVNPAIKPAAQQHPLAGAPRVSVIIPAYNQARYLGYALQSVLAQTVRDFEIVVVDDGSTDDTAAVAQAYAAQGPADTPLQLVRQANQGLAGARNSGIRAAQGEFVALLDSDDAWEPTYLERMLALAGQNPQAAGFYCAAYFIDEANLRLPQPPVGAPHPGEDLYWSLLRANYIIPSTALLRRQAVVDAGLFDADFRRVEDWDLWLRLLRSGHTLVGAPEALVAYRVHAASLSKDPNSMQRAVMAMVAKQFGPALGDPQSWPADKRRAYGSAYRYQALSAISPGGDWGAAAAALRQGLEIDPELADDSGMFYELALGDQLLGRRGVAVDLQNNARQIEQLLASVFALPAPDTLLILQARTWAHAYQALGLAAYHQGQFELSRRWLWRALRRRPALAVQRSLFPFLLKASLGLGSLIRLRRLSANRPGASKA